MKDENFVSDEEKAAGITPVRIKHQKCGTFTTVVGELQDIMRCEACGNNYPRSEFDVPAERPTST